MKCNMYSVFDKKAKEFSMPQNFKNDDCAKRWFCNVMKECELIKNDMELCSIGIFDNETSLFESKLECIFCGYDVVITDVKEGDDNGEEVQA